MSGPNRMSASGRDRGLLDESHVEEFVAWAEARGWKRAKTKGHYEVLRLVRRDRRPGDHPAIYYQRDRSTRHLTAWGVGLDLAKSFINGVIRPRRQGLIDRDKEEQPE